MNFRKERKKKLNIFGSVRLIISSTINPGYITTPTVFALSGLLGGILIVAVSAINASILSYFLCICAMKEEESQSLKNKNNEIELRYDNENEENIEDSIEEEMVTYSSLSKDLGISWIPSFINGIKALKCYSMALLIFMFVVNLITKVYFSYGFTVKDEFSFRMSVGLIVSLILCPMTIAYKKIKPLSKLTHITTFGILFLMLTVGILPVFAKVNPTFSLFFGEKEILTAFILMTFATTIQTSVITVVSHLKNMNRTNIIVTLLTSSGFASLMHLVIGICSYLVLGDIGESNLLLLLISQNNNIIFRDPVYIQPMKTISYVAIFIFIKGLIGMFVCQNFLAVSAFSEFINHGHNPSLNIRLATGIMQFFVYNVASLYITDVFIVIKFITIICNPFIGFIFPSLFFAKRTLRNKRYINLVLPIIFLVFGLFFLIYLPVVYVQKLITTIEYSANTQMLSNN